MGLFQSAPPVKGATIDPSSEMAANEVSIRAPREGGDLLVTRMGRVAKSFNPRPP